MSKLENTIASCHGAGEGGGGAGSQQRSLLSKYATVMLLLLDAMPSFYYVMCGVFAIMPA